MLTLANLHNTDFDKFEIDEQWGYTHKPENKMHRIHAYPAKFPAFITKKALQLAEAENFQVNTVADIFCGCGTTAYEASRNGKSFWGCDINPVATLIAKVKSDTYKQSALDKYFFEIINLFDTSTVEREILANINGRIKYWFNDTQIEELSKLKIAIYESTSSQSKYRGFFLCAFSNILKSTSRWLQKSIKPTIDPNKTLIDVKKAFHKQFTLMKKANIDNNRPKGIRVNIKTNNFLNTRQKKKADLLVTSPPYVTSYEYADLHQLSLLWLDLAEDFRVFRDGSVGSLYHNSDFDKNKSQLNTAGELNVLKLLKADKNRAKNAAKYFVDMQKAIEKSNQLLNTGGYALFVIGNTEYKQVRIDNAKHLVESMLTAGYENIRVKKRKISNKFLTPYRDKSGKFTSDKTSRKIYAEEFVVIGRKQ